MKAAKQLNKQMSLSKSLKYTGVSRCMWYYTPKPRDIPLNEDIVELVRKIGIKRPTYGTRRMAAQIERETGTPVNRKNIQRIYREIGWTEPTKTRNEIIHTNRKLFKPDAPNKLWETDITYIWCGDDTWCYSFNVLDCFTRKWLSYAFDVNATMDVAVDSITNAVAVEKPDCSKLLLRTDNGKQYTGRAFRRAVQALGIGKHEFIWKNTTQQNGHVESFHGTLKKEYIWLHDFANYQQAEKVLAEAFADYNTERIHSSIGYLTPTEFAEQWEMTHK